MVAFTKFGLKYEGERRAEMEELESEVCKIVVAATPHDWFV